METTPLLFGIFLQSSMIMALGAQNLFILEKGLQKDRPYLVALICSFCDVSLIFMGVLGAGSFFAQNATLTLILKVAGAAFLFKYAYAKYKEAKNSQNHDTFLTTKITNLRGLILSSLAVSLLNPHVYLDTFVLIGGYSTNYQSLEDKLNFALGAGLFSIFWFFSVGLGAGLFSSALKNPKTMKFINYSTSALMTYLGINLLWLR